MPRGNWGIVFAAVLGLAVYLFSVGFGLGALSNPQPDGYPTYRDAAEDRGQTNAPVLHERTEAPEERQPCRNPESREESDLCAQYRAANAATEAAYWARLQLWISLGGVIGLATTIAITIRATKAALHSNEIASDTAKMQLRAWLAPDGGTPQPLANAVAAGVTHAQGFSFTLLWKNTGVSPAIDVRVFCIDHKGATREAPVFKERIRGADDLEDATCNVGADQGLSAPAKALLGSEMESWRKGNLHWFIYSRVDYRDIFGEPHTSECCAEIQCHGLKPRGGGLVEYNIGIRWVGPQNRLT